MILVWEYIYVYIYIYMCVERHICPSEGFPRLAYLGPWARVGTGGGRISRIVGVPRVSRGPMGTGPWAQGPWAQGPWGQWAHGPMGLWAQPYGTRGTPRILEILPPPVPTRTWAEISQSWKPLTGMFINAATDTCVWRRMQRQKQGPLA